MSQGKAFTPEEKESIIKSLQPYLEMGFSRNKACEFIGLAPQTLSVWVQDDESLRMKLTGWENVVNTIAMQNIVQAIQKENESEDLRLENTWKWADRKMKDDGFTTKTETDVTTNGKDLPSPIISIERK
jgi:transposase-like protein